MATKINKFAILGERCTGTNCLEEAILKNFILEFTAEYGNKHFYCYNNYNKKDTKDVLFIGIVRNPIYWLNSFSKELHHVPSVNKKSLQSFLFNEFYSVEKIKDEHNFYGNNLLLNNNLNYNKEVVNPRDLNYLNGNKYKNIFELRKLKHNYLMKVMPNKVNNFILINYEDILYNFEITMKIIKNKFNLIQKLPTFEKVTKYKKSNTYNFVKQRDITFSVETIKLIWKNLDIQQENSLGYFPFNNNYFFVEKYKFEKIDETTHENIDENIDENMDENMDETTDDLINKKKQPMTNNVYEKMSNYIYKKIEKKNMKDENNNNYTNKSKNIENINEKNINTDDNKITLSESIQEDDNESIEDEDNESIDFDTDEKNMDIDIHESEYLMNYNIHGNNINFSENIHDNNSVKKTEISNNIIDKHTKINAIKMLKKKNISIENNLLS